MTFDWTFLYFEDLSGIWLECDVGSGMYLMVEFDSRPNKGYLPGFNYGSDLYDFVSGPYTRSLNEAKEIAIALFEAWCMEELGKFKGMVGL